MASAGRTVKAALHTALASAYATHAPAVQVSYGHPGPTVVEDLVAVTTVVAEQEPGPMRTGPRTREENLRLGVVISCYRGGGADVQQTTTEAAFALLTILEDTLAVDPTIGGTVRWGQVEAYELVEADDPDVLARGRVTEITVTVQASARNVPDPPT